MRHRSGPRGCVNQAASGPRCRPLFHNAGGPPPHPAFHLANLGEPRRKADRPHRGWGGRSGRRRSVSRVLSRVRVTPRRGGDHSSRVGVTRHLRQPTRKLGRAALQLGRPGFPLRPRRLPMRPCSRWGLPCRPRYRGRGGLLPRRFTLTVESREASDGGFFSVALSSAFPSPGVTRHRALRSSDFPPARDNAASRRPPERRRR